MEAPQNTSSGSEECHFISSDPIQLWQILTPTSSSSQWRGAQGMWASSRTLAPTFSLVRV